MLWAGSDPSGAMLIPTVFSFLNGVWLALAFAALPRFRRSSTARCVVFVYMCTCLGVYLSAMDPELLERPVFIAHCMVALGGYFPVFVYLLSAAAESVTERFLLRYFPERYDLTGRHWNENWRHVAKYNGNNHLLTAKREELALRPTDAHLRRELVEIYLAMEDADSALFHSYVLAELLPRGQAHALALYRTAQILVERKRQLAGAQPCLRRIIRLYPRSFFASYARRLVNHYEAYADLEA